ncbi:hypothetical protein V3C99_001043 [Haemonchus contortus]
MQPRVYEGGSPDRNWTLDSNNFNKTRDQQNHVTWFPGFVEFFHVQRHLVLSCTMSLNIRNDKSLNS